MNIKESCGKRRAAFILYARRFIKTKVCAYKKKLVSIVPNWRVTGENKSTERKEKLTPSA
jgi:hypothetical protein